jgi:tetratricopeptide (TPR) repeat protein
MSVAGGAGPEDLLREAQSLQGQGRAAEAIAAYQRLLASYPGLPDSWYNLGLLLRHVRQFSAALAAYQQALDHGVRQPEEVHLNRGVIYSDHLHQHAAAERELQAALALNPTYVPAWLNLANMHEDLGRRQPARVCYEKLLELEPGNLQALSRYAGLSQFALPEDAMIKRLQRALEQQDASSADRAAVGFALGRALDSCGAFDSAFEAYVAANRHSRDSAPPGTAPYDREAAEHFTDRLIAAFPRERVYSAPPASGAAAHRLHPQPIFICGMFRSGSTLIEQLLAQHASITAGGELDVIPHLVQQTLAPFPESLSRLSPPQLEQLATYYLQALATVFPGALNVTDKRPDNFLYVGLIKLLLPEAKIVHTVREPLDNCLSVFFLHLDQRMSYALNLLDIGHYYVQYTRLMRHWQAVYGADIVDVSYDRYVHTPEMEADRLFTRLGLDWHGQPRQVASQHAVRTASAWQVREPLYRSSSGRSRNYTRQLRELQDYLQAALPSQQRNGLGQD